MDPSPWVINSTCAPRVIEPLIHHILPSTHHWCNQPNRPVQNLPARSQPANGSEGVSPFGWKPLVTLFIPWLPHPWICSNLFVSSLCNFVISSLHASTCVALSTSVIGLSLERAVSQASCCHPSTCGPSTWAPLTSSSARPVPCRGRPCATQPRHQPRRCSVQRRGDEEPRDYMFCFSRDLSSLVASGSEALQMHALCSFFLSSDGHRTQRKINCLVER
jgi:hypothetical protein